MKQPTVAAPANVADPADLRAALLAVANDPHTDERVRDWLLALIDDPTESPTHHPTRPA